MKIPQFLYVPRVNTLGDTKLIVETRKDIYFRVFDFATLDDRNNWLNENRVEIEKHYSVNLHKKYPIALLCLGVKKNIDAESLIKIGNMACDWYVQFYLKNQKLSKPIFNPDAPISEKMKEYFKHWVWGDNSISHTGKVFLINLEYSMCIRFDYGDAFFASFEDFESDISNIQFLNGERPDDETVRKLIIDAWNFLGIQERIDDGFGMEDINDDIFD